MDKNKTLSLYKRLVKIIVDLKRFERLFKLYIFSAHNYRNKYSNIGMAWCNN